MSTKITVDSSGLKALSKSINKLGKNAEVARLPMMQEISFLLHGKAVNKLKGKRSGLFYKRRTVVHQASAEGESPKTDTGFLLSSLRRKATKRFAIVNTNAKYGAILEDKLDRPWLKPTLEESEPAINQIIAKHIARAIA